LIVGALTRAKTGPVESMVFVSGGRSGWARRLLPEERPVGRFEVDDFWMDEHPVTVGEFRRFVKATGYVTRAEQPLDPADYPDAVPPCSCPDRWSFQLDGRARSRSMTTRLVALRAGGDVGAAEGPESNAYDRGRHPVVHVAHEDAAAYAAWAGKALPSEANGSTRPAVGWTRRPSAGRRVQTRRELMANTWHGEFPHQHDRPDPWIRTSPVKTYPPTATPGRHGRQRLGVDRRLLLGRAA